VEGPEQQRQLRFSSTWTFFIGVRAMRFSALAFLCAVVVCACVAKAEIATWHCDNDHDDAINCVQTGWIYDHDADTYNLNIEGSQFWGPGHMLMDFTTNSADDPTIKSMNAVINDTVPYFAWTGYAVKVTLDTDAPLTTGYGISNVTVANPANDWTVTSFVNLAPNGMSVQYPGYYEYVGSMTFDTGTPIGFGDELDFSYKISFAGATTYHAIQEMTPIPEPASIALALGGLAVLLVMRRKFA
jgi:hypothetical protein